MSLHVTHTERVAAQPWRNGGGLTRELLAWPAGADWQLRISVAEITHDGAFSAFPGVQRWFAVLQGAGVALRFGDDALALDVDSPAFEFSGDLAPGCTLADGATCDLNFMVVRAHGRGQMHRLAEAEELLGAAPFRAVFCASAARLVVDGLALHDIAAMSLVYSDSAAHERWLVQGLAEPLRAWGMSYQPGSYA